MYYVGNIPCIESDIKHFGISGMKWGVRRYQNPDGTLTEEGKDRYYKAADGTYKKRGFVDRNYRIGQREGVAKSLLKGAGRGVARTGATIAYNRYVAPRLAGTPVGAAAAAGITAFNIGDRLANIARTGIRTVGGFNRPKKDELSGKNPAEDKLKSMTTGNRTNPEEDRLKRMATGNKTNPAEEQAKSQTTAFGMQKKDNAVKSKPRPQPQPQTQKQMEAYSKTVDKFNGGLIKKFNEEWDRSHPNRDPDEPVGPEYDEAFWEYFNEVYDQELEKVK